MKNFSLGVLIFFFLILDVKAEPLSFNSILDKAIKNSYDLQISKIDIRISEAVVKETRSEYFPVINLGYNAGYDRNLSDGGSAITPVGDSILLNNTRYQNSASIGLQYNLFDFGVRGKKLKIAKKDKTQKQTRYSINLLDLKIELADLYTKTLLHCKEYNSNNQLLKLNTELFLMQEKLYDSGIKPKTDLIEQAIKVARITNKIDGIRTEFQKNLEDLSFYTGEEYNINDLELFYLNQNEFEPVNFEKKEINVTDLKNTEDAKLHIEAVKTDFFNIENLPEYKYYQLEIEKKQAELAILNRQRLPHFKFYTNYYLYGTDKNDYWGTFG
ncbi:MAG: TolC family protein, partial [Candidatus Aenigmarchaeota archaeon]|nr:TolC family protein [Candidatus Aenigmarchaeota archaeon]